MTEIQLEERKEISLNILRVIDQVCKQNNITYYLAYGTLLGAIRHKGFIPWDDDIDIWVYVQDFERFLQIIDAQTPYDSLIYGNPPGCLNIFAKISDGRTAIVDNGSEQLYSRGISVDVFPLCQYPASRLRQRISAIIKRVLDAAIYTYEPTSTAKKLLIRLIKFAFRNPVRLMYRYLCKSYKRADYLYNPFSLYGIRDFHSPELFKDETALFEGVEFNIPAGYDEILSNIYGDYMQPPPPEKRVSHHDEKAFWI